MYVFACKVTIVTLFRTAGTFGGVNIKNVVMRFLASVTRKRCITDL